MKKTYSTLLFFFLFIVQITFGQNAAIANDDTNSTEQNTVLTVASPGLLSNDTDADGEDLEVILVHTNLFFT